MVKTLGLGRIPRVAGSGLRFQVGTVKASSTVGSFAVDINTIRHVELAWAAPTSGTLLSGSVNLPVGYGSHAKWVYFKTMKFGTNGRPAAKTGTFTLSYLVVGE